jgi:hypothetical protein
MPNGLELFSSSFRYTPYLSYTAYQGLAIYLVHTLFVNRSTVDGRLRYFMSLLHLITSDHEIMKLRFSDFKSHIKHFELYDNEYSADY